MKKWQAIQVRQQMDEADSGFTFLGFDTSDTALNYVVMARELDTGNDVRFSTMRQWEGRGSRGRGRTAVAEGERPEPDNGEEESPPEDTEDAEEESGEESEESCEESPAEEPPRSSRRSRSRN